MIVRLDIFIFSHDQWMFSPTTFHKVWNLVFAGYNVLLYVMQLVFYVIFFVDGHDVVSRHVEQLTYVVAIISLCMPFVMLLVFFYFSTIALSGFPFNSMLAKERVAKINTVYLVWTVGRVLRGSLLLASLMHQWENLFDDLSLSFIISGILVVAEILPFYLSLDWSTISILLTGMNDERQALLNPTLSPHVRIQTERRLTSVSKVYRMVVERAT
jgi:hypothetical protein